MTTTSSNIAGVIRPIGGKLKRQVPGRIYDIDEITPTGSKKQKKKCQCVLELLSIGDEVLLVEASSKTKSVVNGKTGVWRTIRGRRHFFPDDGAGPIPPIGSKIGTYTSSFDL